MRAPTRLENKQNYGAICITCLFLIPKRWNLHNDDAGIVNAGRFLETLLCSVRALYRTDDARKRRPASQVNYARLLKVKKGFRVMGPEARGQKEINEIFFYSGFSIYEG